MPGFVLPLLEPHRSSLETCVFCPKLSRAACPVSNVEANETVTPWGKMSMAYFVANESVPLTSSFAQPAWACTGCFGCREHCDHKNDVTGTLFAARSALAEAGEMPEGARRVLDGFAARTRVLAQASASPRLAPFVDPKSRVAVLVGCEHARRAVDAGPNDTLDPGAEVHADLEPGGLPHEAATGRSDPAEVPVHVEVALVGQLQAEAFGAAPGVEADGRQVDPDRGEGSPGGPLRDRYREAMQSA